MSGCILGMALVIGVGATPELAPPPRPIAPGPWERTDLKPLTELESSVARDIRLGAMTFLEYALIEGFKPEVAVRAALPGATITTTTVERIRGSGLWRSNVEAVYVSDKGAEAVAVTFEAQLQIGGKANPGHVVVTLAQDDKGVWKAKSVAIADAATLKPLVEAYYEANPDRRPKGKAKP
ncbi:MAG: hypothetical protein K8U57_01365 [Planctomycetes bacterium]|nr:hypothetical protein [Planctomycetota bacterium]